MAEPQIRYARTPDGVSIAYWTLGRGKPLLLGSPLAMSHIQLESRYPELRAWYERLAERRMVIRYDLRGMGMSQRGLTNFHHDMWLSDMDAVVDDLDLPTFDVMGCAGNGPEAVSYAVRNPSRVSRLVLWRSIVRGADFLEGTLGQQAASTLLDTDWETYTETAAHATLGWSNHELAGAWARFMRASISQEDWIAIVRADDPETDITPLLGAIRCPTLVMYRDVAPASGSGPGPEVASGIPGARLALFGGNSPLPFGPAADEIYEAITRFLDEDGGTIATPTAAQGTAVILFADIVNSTALTERIGDAAFHRQSEALHRALREALASCGGRVVEGRVLGDGVMAVFDAAKDAIAAAGRCHGAASAAQLQLHVGVHAGDVIRDENDVHGGAVNIAARIAAASAPGETLVSDVVRALGRTSAGVRFDDRGEHALKGIEEPQRLFAVRPQL